MNQHRYKASGPLTNYEIQSWREAEADGRRLHWGHLWDKIGNVIHFKTRAEWELYKAGLTKGDANADA